jgi:hypothetical protein
MHVQMKLIFQIIKINVNKELIILGLLAFPSIFAKVFLASINCQ